MVDVSIFVILQAAQYLKIQTFELKMIQNSLKKESIIYVEQNSYNLQVLSFFGGISFPLFKRLFF